MRRDDHIEIGQQWVICRQRPPLHTVDSRPASLPRSDLCGLLNFLRRLESAMKTDYGYANPISPFDLVLGMSGARSGFAKQFRTTATGGRSFS